MSEFHLRQDSEPMSLGGDQSNYMLSTISRLEKKVDRLSDIIGNLVRFEERQANQSKDITDIVKELVELKANLQNLQRKVDQWINRGIGAWTLAVIAGSILGFMIKR